MQLFGWERVDRENADYKACVAITTAGGAIVGGATGSVVPGAGNVAGYAAGGLWGFVLGYLACPYLAPVVRRKIESGMPLTHIEIRSASEAMGSYAGVNSAPDAVKLVRLVKIAGGNKSVAPTCSNPAETAKQLLRHV